MSAAMETPQKYVLGLDLFWIGLTRLGPDRTRSSRRTNFSDPHGRTHFRARCSTAHLSISNKGKTSQSASIGARPDCTAANCAGEQLDNANSFRSYKQPDCCQYSNAERDQVLNNGTIF